jgi:Periplasmic protein involved in polysaccharide export
MRTLRFSSIVLIALLQGACFWGKATPEADQAVTPTGGSSESTGGNSSTSNTTTAPVVMATDPGYRLALGDEISITVHGEPDLSAAQRIDRKGIVRIPYINEVSLANKTVREAEGFIEQLLIERRILKKPLVNITVRDYALREVTISGTGMNPGVFQMPRETDSIEIVELVNRLGGFRPTARSNAVRVIRMDENGNEVSHIVDVEAMMKNRKGAPKSFLIYPGDRIHVEERFI